MPQTGPRVLSEEVAHNAIRMLRGVVKEGTATLADVPGYQVAGKTGTAEKPNKAGGYDNDKVVNTFAAMFPADEGATDLDHWAAFEQQIARYAQQACVANAGVQARQFCCSAQVGCAQQIEIGFVCKDAYLRCSCKIT